ncbi:MAG: hypothetical protein L3K13_08405 [Thermoplasmata archaeon]|nr:hypothetical protein [Thermoplasmata archaeon]
MVDAASTEAVRSHLPEGWTLGEAEPAVAARLAGWDANDAAGSIWRKDPTFWPAADPREVPDRLGWLRLPESMGARLEEITAFAKEVRASHFARILLLGMGGSSLASSVFALTWGRVPGYPELEILDSTHPAAVRRATREEPERQTLFLVSSKSGTTLEPNSLFEHFWARLSEHSSSAGENFVAITDPGTPLSTLATSHGFRRLFSSPPDVGGRYSALTEFGLIPAALAGIDVRRVVQRAREMAEESSPAVTASRNPGLLLGAALGELARRGRNKVTFVTSPALSAFPAWAEQLIAESTGKRGTGIVPVAGEVAPFEPTNSGDRVLVALCLRGEDASGLEAGLAKATAAGIPVLRFSLDELDDLGAEFFRWELAVAATGPILGIDPFDQPDVERAKEFARRAMTRDPRGGGPEVPLVRVDQPAELLSAFTGWLDLANVGDYLAIQAFLAPSEDLDRELLALRSALRRKLRISSTLGYGPRFLHSTGQLHKGGPPTGLFLQLVDEPRQEVELPGGAGSFGGILRAQAAGDAEALREKHRRLLRVQLGQDAAAGLRALTADVAA